MNLFLLYNNEISDSKCIALSAQNNQQKLSLVVTYTSCNTLYGITQFPIKRKNPWHSDKLRIRGAADRSQNLSQPLGLAVPNTRNIAYLNCYLLNCLFHRLECSQNIYTAYSMGNNLESGADLEFVRVVSLLRQLMNRKYEVFFFIN